MLRMPLIPFKHPSLFPMADTILNYKIFFKNKLHIFQSFRALKTGTNIYPV